MSTFYLDYVNGNDSNNGSSWALAWKTLTSGATGARVAAGDTVRIAKSPDPTSLGINGTWTNGPIGAANSIVSSTGTTPIVVTLGAGHGVVTGDVVIVAGHSGNTKACGVWNVTVSGNSITLLNANGSNSAGAGTGTATGTLRKITSAVVTLASAVTQNICLAGNYLTKTVWSAVGVNTVSNILTTDWKEGLGSEQAGILAAFTTGLSHYFPTGTLNLSAYQQLSFWVKQTAGTLGAAGSLSLKLCSDAAGATPVNTFNIPAIGALNTWMPVTVDLATNLGSSIQSIALYVNTDNGAQTFLFDNIIACKASSAADSLTLTSLVGKNTGTEPWHGIQSINGTRVVLDQHTNMIPGALSGAVVPQQGYSGTTETVTTYKRETIKTAIASGISIHVQDFQRGGTAGSVVTYQGGYNTGSSTVDGDTIFDGQNGYGYGLGLSNLGYITVSGLSTVRYYYGWVVSCTSTSPNVTISSATLSNNISGMTFSSGSTVNSLTLGSANNNWSNGIYLNACEVTASIDHADGNVINPGNLANIQLNNATVCSLTVGTSNNGGDIGIYLTNSDSNSITATNVDGNYTSGIQTNASANLNLKVTHFSPGLSSNQCLYAITSNNITADLQLYNSGQILITDGDHFLKNTTFSGSSRPVQSTRGGFFIWSMREGGVDDVHYGYTDGGLIASDATTRHTASGISWKMSPTSTNRTTAYPLPLKVATAAVDGTNPVTVAVWVYRTNTGITARLRCPAGQLSGYTEQVTTASGAASTWEQLSVSVTPNIKGVLEFWVETFGGTTYSTYVDDITVS